MFTGWFFMVVRRLPATCEHCLSYCHLVPRYTMRGFSETAEAVCGPDKRLSAPAKHGGCGTLPQSHLSILSPTHMVVVVILRLGASAEGPVSSLAVTRTIEAI